MMIFNVLIYEFDQIILLMIPSFDHRKTINLLQSWMLISISRGEQYTDQYVAIIALAAREMSFSQVF